MALFQSLTKTMRFAIWGAALAIPAGVLAESLAERVDPVGETCMAGDPCAAAATAAAGSSGPRSGEEIYSTKCSTCHATGAAGAPKLDDAESWQARLEERGKEGLYDSAINGFKGMPAMGLCMDCSDEEIKATVDYILENI